MALKGKWPYNGVTVLVTVMCAQSFALSQWSGQVLPSAQSRDIFAVETEVDAGDESAVAAEGAGEPRVRERLLRVLLLLLVEPLLLPGSVLLLRCLRIALRFFHVYKLHWEFCTAPRLYEVTRCFPRSSFTPEYLLPGIRSVNPMLSQKYPLQMVFVQLSSIYHAPLSSVYNEKNSFSRVAENFFLFVFYLVFLEDTSFFTGHWYPCFGLLVMSALKTSYIFHLNHVSEECHKVMQCSDAGRDRGEG